MKPPNEISRSRDVRSVIVYLGDRLRYGVSIMAPRGLQISSLDQFGDHLTEYLEGGLTDFVHGLKVQAPVG
jgi:hypothetical protein